MFLEDAGFDWKILGPDVANLDYIAWQCDQDAYACSGQKCSAQSLLFMHKNWAQAGEHLPCPSLLTLCALRSFSVGSANSPFSLHVCFILTGAGSRGVA